ncbi:MAG: surface carbohydrate biosynthesis protein [Erythrobacter sp.]
MVDHPLRDLDGMCLVAQKLTERGHEAVLLPFYTQHFDLPNCDLDVLVLNYVRPANRALVEAAAARGVALAVLDTEGGLIPEDGPTSAGGIACYLRQSGLDERLALYLFWGDHLRNAVIGQTALPPARAIVTGCPRFDLARPAPARRRGRVLVNTNFPVVNSAHALEGEIDADALRSVGFGEREITDLAQTVLKVMLRMIEAVRALAIARPDRIFVIRPHPFEQMAPYETAFADLANVSVERVGTAMEALSRSSCLLHVNCTTAIEACLTGVPAISLDFVNEPRLEAMARLPSQISHRAQSLAKAVALIDRAPRLETSIARDRIEPYFGPLDGRAAIRVAEALTSLPLPAPAPGSWPLPARRRIARMLGRTLGSGVIEGVRRWLQPSRRMKGFGVGDARTRVAKFARASGQDPARVEQSRSALGLPVMALTLNPPGGDGATQTASSSARTGTHQDRLNGKSFLATGAAGSFCQPLVRRVLELHPDIARLVIFSRAEAIAPEHTPVPASEAAHS